jgi:hypothetical protein
MLYAQLTFFAQGLLEYTSNFDVEGTSSNRVFRYSILPL